MTTLFDLENYTTPKVVHDPYWDEIVLDSSGSVEENGQLTLFYDDSQEPPDPDDYPNLEEYEIAFAKWRSLNPDVKIEEMSVLEDEKIRVSELPEQVNKQLPEHRKTQWVEEYSVKRSGTKHWYYRYCYYANRKIYHIHIPGGNYQSVVAIERKEMVERVIALGKTHWEIENFIRGGFGLNGNKMIFELRT
jgi:hypothetical protein